MTNFKLKFHNDTQVFELRVGAVSSSKIKGNDCQYIKKHVILYFLNSSLFTKVFGPNNHVGYTGFFFLVKADVANKKNELLLNINGYDEYLARLEEPA